MNLNQIFFNSAGRLRGGWRLLLFFTLYTLVLTALAVVARVAQMPLSPVAVAKLRALFSSGWGFLIERGILFVVVALVSYLCLRLLEGLPWRSLGWALHTGWRRDLLSGIGIGAATLLLALLPAAVVGGWSFDFNHAAAPALILRTLVGSALIFLVGAALEELLFRGYPLQTLLRSLPLALAIVPSSIYFAYVHLTNPNARLGWTFVNTLLAGVWLAIAYYKTRSLWFPLGVHWSWNWVQGALLGIPVSGIKYITPDPLLRATDTGPAWLTGGTYGVEGGAACAVALILSTVFIWRTRLLDATEEMRSFTVRESARES